MLHPFSARQLVVPTFLVLATSLFYSCGSPSSEVPALSDYSPGYEPDSITNIWIDATSMNALPPSDTLESAGDHVQLGGKNFSGLSLLEEDSDILGFLLGGGGFKKVLEYEDGVLQAQHTYFVTMNGYRLISSRVELTIGSNRSIRTTTYLEQGQMVVREALTLDSTDGTNDFYVHTKYYPIEHAAVRQEERTEKNGTLTSLKRYSFNNQLVYEEVNGQEKPVVLNGRIETRLESGETLVEEYENGTKTGFDVTYYPSGKPKSTRAPVNGPYVEYHENGTVAVEATLVNGEFEGEYRSFYKNGNKWRIYNYKDGKKNGAWEAWYTNGNLGKTGTYENDREIGIYEEFYDTGKRWKRIERLRSSSADVSGSYESWYTNDLQAEVYSMLNGKKHGLYKKFDTEGYQLLEVNFFEDKKHGKYTSWSDSDTPDKVTWYFKDKEETEQSFNARLEEWPEYTETRELTEEDGKTTVTYNGSFKNGNNGKQYTHVNGRLEGAYTVWYPNGKKRMQTMYRNGRRHGHVQTWYDDGTIAEDLYFFKDIKVSGAEEFARMEQAAAAGQTESDSDKYTAILEANKTALDKSWSINEAQSHHCNLPPVNCSVKYPASMKVERAIPGRENDNYASFAYFFEGQAMQSFSLGNASGYLEDDRLNQMLMNQLKASLGLQVQNLKEVSRGKRFIRGKQLFHMGLTYSGLDEDTQTQESYKMLIVMVPVTTENGIIIIGTANDKDPNFNNTTELAYKGLIGKLWGSLEVQTGS